MDPFLPYIASGRDISLHFLIARRAAGASRALYEPFLTTVMESGTAGLVLSGDRPRARCSPAPTPGNFPPGRGLFVRRGERPASDPDRTGGRNPTAPTRRRSEVSYDVVALIDGRPSYQDVLAGMMAAGTGLAGA